jgi:hypothetical protein
LPDWDRFAATENARGSGLQRDPQIDGRDRLPHKHRILAIRRRARTFQPGVEKREFPAALPWHFSHQAGHKCGACPARALTFADNSATFLVAAAGI